MASNDQFDEPSERSDVVLLVEEKKLHVNKHILSHASPVFARMFEGEFKERNADEIPLPDKSYQGVLQMLRCIYPSILEDVTMENVDVILKLADEYQILSLKGKSERLLTSAVKTCKPVERKLVVHCMYLGQRYDLETLLEASIEQASHMIYKGSSFNEMTQRRNYNYLCGIYREDEYALLSEETKIRYLSKRVHVLEVQNKLG